MTSKTFLMLLLPLQAPAQFMDIARELCHADKMGIVVFGENYALAEDIQGSRVAARCNVYRLDLSSEFARRIKQQKPAVYLFDRNLFALASAPADLAGWNEISRCIPAQPALDCLLTVQPADKSEPAPLPSPAAAEPDPEVYKAAPGGEQSGTWLVQFGVFSSGTKAAQLARQIPYSFIMPRILDGRPLYAVVRDLYDTAEDAAADAKRHGAIARRKF